MIKSFFDACAFFSVLCCSNIDSSSGLRSRCAEFSARSRLPGMNEDWLTFFLTPPVRAVLMCGSQNLILNELAKRRWWWHKTGSWWKGRTWDVSWMCQAPETPLLNLHSCSHPASQLLMCEPHVDDFSVARTGTRDGRVWASIRRF